MDAGELFTSQLDDAEYQLRQVFSGLPDGAWDEHLVPGTMSPRETAAHLAEAYVAGVKHFRGEEHDWGTYQPASTEPTQILDEMFQERDKLKAAALAAEDHTGLKTAIAYSASHDYYHIGQMCSLRLKVEPNWNPYSIYKS